MVFKAQGGTVQIHDGVQDYVTFGRGEKILLMIPGLSDGLKTVRGLALPMAWMYRYLARDYRVYIISRKRDMPDVYSTRDMAADLGRALDSLSISKADVIGLSQGGMIAQFLAADYPQRVGRLVLAVTVARANPTLQDVIGHWLELGRQGDYSSLIHDTMEKTYTEKTFNKYRPVLPLLSRIGRPRDFRRFLIMGQACLEHDAWDALGNITSPTLVIGGGKDRVVGEDSSTDLAERIPHARLKLYPNLGHGAFEEASDFNEEVARFLSESMG